MKNNKEIWKPIVGYEDCCYEVSNQGHIRRWGGRILKPYTNGKSGYLIIKLFKNGEKKQCLIHRLVAEAFIPNPKKYNEVNHMDFNRQNNNANNLEWCSHDYNMKYNKQKNKSPLQLSFDF